MSMTLYAAPMSSAMPVVHALAELEVPHEIVWFDLAAQDQKKDAFLALNPNGKVPALVYEGTPMFEGLAITQWLGERFGVERSLWPAADAPPRLTAMAWSAWAYASFQQIVHRLQCAEGPQADPRWHNAALARASHAELQRLLGVLDGRLAGREYVLGEFSLVDVIVGSMIVWGTYCGVSVDAHPNVRGWVERFRARPAFQKT